MEPGYIYILKNPALREDLLKIGMTTRSPHDRIAELSNVTGVPAHFELKFVEWVPNCREAEQLLHARLDEYRYAKEFFSLPIDQAIAFTRDIADSLRGIMPTEASPDTSSQDAPHTHSLCEDDEVIYTSEGLDEALPDDLEFESSHANPPSSLEQRKDFTATLRRRITCLKCGEVFWVTFRRYEGCTVCPKCHSLTGEVLTW